MTKHIQLITFDLDNTLWDVHDVIVRAETTMRAWLDEEVPGFNESVDTNTLMTLRKRLVEENPGISHNLSELRRLTLNEALKQFGCSPEQATTNANKAFAIFIEMRHDVRYFDGAIDMLRQLSSQYTLGALSNGNADIKKLGLDEYFSFSFSAADIGMSKPAPDMFQAALTHTESDPSRSVHIGDHLIDDIEGANKMGMHTIWFNQHEPDATHAATRMAENLQELPQLIETINQEFRE